MFRSGSSSGDPKSIVGWRRLFFRRDVFTKTTWTFRLAAVAAIGLLVWSTQGMWVPAVGRNLVCDGRISTADALLIDALDPSYSLFESAASLRNAGYASRAYVPLELGEDAESAGIAAAFNDVLTRAARLHDSETIPVRFVEPISLNVAYQIRDFLMQQHVKSLLVVSPGFRSRRTMLIYNTAFNGSGISLSCAPVFGRHTETNWIDTWHGIEDVGEQFLKLEYYRLYVLPLKTAERKESNRTSY